MNAKTKSHSYAMKVEWQVQEEDFRKNVRLTSQQQKANLLKRCKELQTKKKP